MDDEIWVLGATGRTGRAIAARLHAAGRPLVLAGRDRERLSRLAAELGGGPRLVVGTLEETLAELGRSTPVVVVNTVGPFTATAGPVARACGPGTHYLDLANEYGALEDVLQQHESAVARGQTLVPGAGFGVLATESILLALLEGASTPARVRVDALAAVAGEAGRIGTALAGSILGEASAGGREVVDGKLQRRPVGGGAERLTTPDGDEVVTSSVPTGDLLAAWRASGAATVVSASSMVPSGRAVRLAFPVASVLLRLPGLTRFAVGRLARVRMTATPMPRPHSWARAQVEWPSGTVREGWLRAPDGMEFTVAVATEVALRLARGEGTPGAGTPGALFGPGLAVAAGGELLTSWPAGGRTLPAA